jgi:hypothetical protein
VEAVCFRGTSPADMVSELMLRAMKRE